MSKCMDRSVPEYWESRLYRNRFTYRGQSREVQGWCMKVQYEGRRRTIRLGAGDRGVAAREAAALYRALREGGWGAVEREQRRLARGWDAEAPGSPGGESFGGVTRVAPRKYVSHQNAGFERELFAELTWDGATEFMALGTEEPNEGALRARDILGELQRGGWGMVHLNHSREATVAVFWQANPMTCTYTTLLTLPARNGELKGTGPKPRGWRILIIEPDGGVRRSLARWLAEGPGVAHVVGVPLVTEMNPEGGWDLILAHRAQAAAAMRLLEARAPATGAGTGPRLLTHGVFADSDAIFASFSGVGRGYVLRRVLPGQLLSPLLAGFPEGPVRGGRAEEDRFVRRHFQAMFEESEPVAVPPVAEFTAREIDILSLLSRGFADKEIGRELGISIWTVHTHLKRIFAKYGVRTRTEAVVRHLQK